ncbi:hypothetical protein L0665_07900 [Methanogenium marinum]|uniref:Uncharacterized protein n=1 Tax=Methanogenium marinum TaxID=348610 RepID=A0A9Q4KUT8_9EURY|nr:hypothetical protein [Methanogenium marinum]MDE4908527.1 hypothetical protein [Methanogenium marinum]
MEHRNKKGRNCSLPLPGILDHHEFERSSVSLGHCMLCGDGVAVYRDVK